VKNFQTIILVAFIVLAVFGILVFSGMINIGGDNAPGALGTVTLWGTLRGSAVLPALEEFNQANNAYVVKYEEKSADNFDQELLEALAVGRGPDLFFLPDNLAYRYANKILPIPYQSFSAASFRRAFAGAGEVFLISRGALALPVLVDPLVMYYNRSILDGSGVALPPGTWEEMVKVVPTLTKKGEANVIEKSAVALGQFANILHAKEILTALFMQTGNPLVKEENGLFSSTVGETSRTGGLPGTLVFYTNFADPLRGNYSWNRSFPNSLDAFSREDLAFYFGLASELPMLLNRNPNQNFGATAFPQVKNANFKLTTGRVMGIALSSGVRNLAGAAAAQNALALGDFGKKLADALAVAPARRDLLSAPGGDAFSPVFYSSALFARSWLDPAPRETESIFQTLVEGVLSGGKSPESALQDADTKLNLLLNRP